MQHFYEQKFLEHHPNKISVPNPVYNLKMTDLKIKLKLVVQTTIENSKKFMKALDNVRFDGF